MTPSSTPTQVIRTIPREHLGTSFLFAIFLVLSAVLATPWLSTIPAAYADGDHDDDDDGDDKVAIYHIPPGNPENAHTLRVSENAVPVHLTYGDTLGECERY
jgi:hypothetical protein